MNSPQCSSCPPSSKSGNASESWGACECSFGAISAVGGTPRCECPAEQALMAPQGREHCVPCAKLHLRCPGSGNKATAADVLEGYARLQRNSSEVFKCLDGKRCTPSGCGAGPVSRNLKHVVRVGYVFCNYARRSIECCEDIQALCAPTANGGTAQPSRGASSAPT